MGCEGIWIRRIATMNLSRRGLGLKILAPIFATRDSRSGKARRGGSIWDYGLGLRVARFVGAKNHQAAVGASINALLKAGDSIAANRRLEESDLQARCVSRVTRKTSCYVAAKAFV